MKYFVWLIILLFNVESFAKSKTTETNHALPDSVKAISYLATVKVHALILKKNVAAGIMVENVSLSLVAEKKEKAVAFVFPKDAEIVARGIGVTSEKGELEWTHDWQTGEDWKLMISIAADSAENFTMYSAYALIPTINKWRLIGSCRLTGWNPRLKSVTDFFKAGKNEIIKADFSSQWVQRNNGSWKNILGQPDAPPTINLISNADSTQQFLLETKAIKDAIASGTTDAINAHEGIYYSIMKEGSGHTVSATDTVVIHYKGYIFSNGLIFDQSKESPATFPLGRLIKGWQIGVPLCKIGGKIKLIIPSAYAYSIRTRAAKIPPNSTLVFEIELLKVNPAIQQ